MPSIIPSTNAEHDIGQVKLKHVRSSLGAIPPPCTLQVSVAGLIVRLAGRAGLPGVTFRPLCREHLGGTRAPAGWPRCKSSGELRLERQYRD